MTEMTIEEFEKLIDRMMNSDSQEFGRFAVNGDSKPFPVLNRISFFGSENPFSSTCYIKVNGEIVAFVRKGKRLLKNKRRQFIELMKAKSEQKNTDILFELLS